MVCFLSSGTESPLLAMGLISDALSKLTGHSLEIDHLFSCEIEPFKQVSGLISATSPIAHTYIAIRLILSATLPLHSCFEMSSNCKIAFRHPLLTRGLRR